MATAWESERQRMEEVLKCSVCLEIFTEPRQLSCYHSFCNNCLEPLPIVVQNGVSGIHCPICRGFTPRGQFGRQFVIDEFLELYRAASTATRPCEVCRNHEHSGDWRCLDCKLNMCNDCHNGHKNIPNCRGHKFRSAEDDDDFTVDRQVYCPNHQDQTIQLQCMSCEVPICVMCRLTDHGNHETETIDKALEKLIPELQIHVSHIEKDAKYLQNATEIFEREIDITEESYALCKNQIGLSANDAIAKAKKDFEEQVKQNEENKEAMIATAQRNYEEEVRRLAKIKEQAISAAIKKCKDEVKQADETKNDVIAKLKKEKEVQFTKLEGLKIKEVDKLKEARNQTKMSYTDKNNTANFARISLENVRGSSLMMELSAGLKDKVEMESANKVDVSKVDIVIPIYSENKEAAKAISDEIKYHKKICGPYEDQSRYYEGCFERLSFDTNQLKEIPLHAVSWKLCHANDNLWILPVDPDDDDDDDIKGKTITVQNMAGGMIKTIVAEQDPYTVCQVQHNEVMLGTKSGLFVLNVEGETQYKVMDGYFCDVTYFKNQALAIELTSGKAVIFECVDGKWKQHSQFDIKNQGSFNRILACADGIYISHYGGGLLLKYSWDGVLLKETKVKETSRICGIDEKSSLLVLSRKENKLQILSNSEVQKEYDLGVSTPFDVLIVGSEMFVLHDNGDKLSKCNV